MIKVSTDPVRENAGGDLGAGDFGGAKSNPFILLLADRLGCGMCGLRSSSILFGCEERLFPATFTREGQEVDLNGFEPLCLGGGVDFSTNCFFSCEIGLAERPAGHSISIILRVCFLRFVVEVTTSIPNIKIATMKTAPTESAMVMVVLLLDEESRDDVEKLGAFMKPSLVLFQFLSSSFSGSSD